MSRQWRIFVVEDDESLHRHVMSALRKDGYVVRGATNKREAVRMLWAEEHDAVICDLKASDDIELLQWLRAYRPNVRVIFVGAPNDAARSFALESGATSYMERPLDVSRLKEELHRLLAQTGFSANLDSFDLLDVIQIVSASRKNIALLVSTGLEERGMLCFQEGNMVWAEYGMLRGEEAFFALAAHKNGTVIHQPWNQRVTPNVTQPLSRLILQALQYRTKYAPQQMGSQQGPMHRGQAEQRLVASSSEEDDTPFLVALEETVYEASSSEPQRQQSQQGYQGYQGQQGPIQRKEFHGVREMTFQGDASGAPQPPGQQEERGRKGEKGEREASKEWWQQTGKMTTQSTTQPSIPPVQQPTTASEDSENTTISSLPRTSVPLTPIFERPLSDSSGMRRVPPGMRKTHMRGEQTGPQEQTQQNTPNDKLPSWLTDQSTASGLSTFSTPVTPAPSVPATPVIRPRQAVRGRSSPEWQGEGDPSHSGPLQSITASRLANTTLAAPGERSSAPVSADSGKQRAVKRNFNYASLVSALQTLGYSVTGFIAAAVVTLDGQPIAQVAVDELDISELCQGLSQVMRTMLQLLRQGNMGEHEDTVMTSGEGYLILRLIRDRGEQGNALLIDTEAFQVLITTRKVDTTECIGMMANVEGAMAAALRSHSTSTIG